MRQPTLIIDLDRCIGCYSCTVACQTLHATPPSVRRINVYQIGPFGTFPGLAMHYLPVMCQHCQDPPCLEACPTGATFKNEDGLVLIEKEACNGCGDCVEACPFQARYIHPQDLIAESCDYCVDRPKENSQPFCAVSCAGGAIRLYDPDHPDPVSAQWLEKTDKNHFQLTPDDGKPGPRTIYLLGRQPWAGWEKISTAIQEANKHQIAPT